MAGVKGLAFRAPFSLFRKAWQMQAYSKPDLLGEIPKLKDAPCSRAFFLGGIDSRASRGLTAGCGLMPPKPVLLPPPSSNPYANRAAAWLGDGPAFSRASCSWPLPLQRPTGLNPGDSGSPWLHHTHSWSGTWMCVRPCSSASGENEHPTWGRGYQRHGPGGDATSWHSKVQPSSIRFNVLRVDTAGRCQPVEVSLRDLGIETRDVDLFTLSTFVPQRATIRLRGSVLLVRMENAQVLLYQDQALIFHASRPSSTGQAAKATQTTRPLGNGAISRSTQLFAALLAEAVHGSASPAHQRLPFQLLLLERVLHETCDFFKHKFQRLKMVVERMLEDLTDDVSMARLHRLLPLKRSLTEIEHDVKDAHLALDEMVGNEDALATLALAGVGATLPPPAGKPSELPDGWEEDARQAALDLLLTFRRELEDVGAAFSELRQDMDSAQEVWELGLDSNRNRIIQINLFLSSATFCISLAIAPAAFFGMNLVSGLEEDSFKFYQVTCACAMTAVATMAAFTYFYHLWPRLHNWMQAQDVAALRDLLQHMDDIDEILDTLRGQGTPLNRAQFQRLLEIHPSGRFMRRREVDLIFRLFDANRDGLLEPEELSRALTMQQPNSLSHHQG